MKRTIRKRGLALLLAAGCALGLLSGCGGGGEETPQSQGNASGMVYVPTYADLKLPAQDYSIIGTSGSTLYLQVWDYGGAASGSDLPAGDAVALPAMRPAMRPALRAPASGSDVEAPAEEVPETEAPATEDTPATEAPVDEAPATDAPVEEVPEYTEPRMLLYAVDLITGESTALTGYVPAETPEAFAQYQNIEGSMSLSSCTVDGQGRLWVVERGWFGYYDTDAEPYTDEYYSSYQELGDVTVLRQLDETGAEVQNIDLSGLKGDQEYFYINSLVVNQAGEPVLAADQDTGAVLLILNSDGSVKSRADLSGGWVDSLIAQDDGSILVKGYFDGNSSVRVLDASGQLGAEQEMPDTFMNANYFYPGIGDYQLFYTDGADNFYGHKAGAATDELLFNWINSDIDSNNLQTVVPQEDGTFLLLSTQWQESGPKTELITLTPTPASEVPQRTQLTLACMYLDYNIRAAVLDFNKKNTEYRIVIQDYSQYNTEEDYTAGLTKLTTEILGGQVPDLLCTDSLPIDRYAAKGLLEDLYPYLDADTDLGGREAIVPTALNCLEVNGILPQIASSMYISTLAGSTEALGGRESWTAQEMLEFSKTLPNGGQTLFGPNYSRENIMQLFVAYDFDSYVDWATGECSFNTPEFAALLEFAAGFPTQDEINARYEDPNYEYESDMARVKRGEQLLVSVSMSDFIYALADSTYAFGEEDVTYIGFPSSDGAGHTANFSGGIAMSSTCADKDGAWSFLRTFLTEDFQRENTWSIPTNQAIFDEKLQEAATPEYYTDPVTGEQVEQSKGGIGWGDGETMEIYALTEGQVQLIRGIIESTTHVMNYDESILNIINEEAAPFFAGQKSAQEAAELIQSRMTIYVNEQR